MFWSQFTNGLSSYPVTLGDRAISEQDEQWPGGSLGRLDSAQHPYNVIATERPARRSFWKNLLGAVIYRDIDYCSWVAFLLQLWSEPKTSNIWAFALRLKSGITSLLYFLCLIYKAYPAIWKLWYFNLRMLYCFIHRSLTIEQNCVCLKILDWALCASAFSLNIIGLCNVNFGLLFFADSRPGLKKPKLCIYYRQSNIWLCFCTY